MKIINKHTFNAYNEGFNYEKFKELFLYEKEPFTIENGENIRYDYVFDSTTYKARGVRFINCEFEGKLTFRNLDLNAGIAFEKCIFKDGVTLSNVNAKVKNLDFSVENAVAFVECEIFNELKVESSIFKNAFKISNCKVTKLIFNSNKITGSAFTLTNSTIETIDSFNENKISKEIAFKKIKVVDETKLISNECDLMNIEDCEFKSDIYINNCLAKSGVTFFKGTFEDNCTIEALKSNGVLSMKHVDFKKACEINYTHKLNKTFVYAGPNELNLDACSFGTGLFICGSDSSEVKTQTNLCLQKVCIIASEKLSGEMNFADLIINTLEIRGSNYKASLIFDMILVTQLNFIYFNNFSTLQLLNISSTTKESEFTISHCNLGNAQFYNCYFKKFQKVKITNSILAKIETSGIEWFDLNKLIKSDNAGMRETFRQLKYAMQQQGNTIQAINFKKFEMKAYQRELYKESNFKLWPDKFILFVNSTNDFGQNWIKPIFILAIFNFVFTVMLVSSIKGLFDLDFSLTSDGLSYFKNELSDFGMVYWPLLNPTILLDKIFDMKIFSGITLLIFFLSRIVLAFFIYQIITAFRKYSK